MHACLNARNMNLQLSAITSTFLGVVNLLFIKFMAFIIWVIVNCCRNTVTFHIITHVGSSASWQGKSILLINFRQAKVKGSQTFLCQTIITFLFFFSNFGSIPWTRIRLWCGEWLSGTAINPNCFFQLWRSWVLTRETRHLRQELHWQGVQVVRAWCTWQCMATIMGMLTQHAHAWWVPDKLQVEPVLGGRLRF